MASLVLLRKSYAAKARDAALVFQTAAEGRIDAAAELLALFEADRHWDTLARLLIAWVAPPDKADEARALVEETAARSCDTPYLQSRADLGAPAAPAACRPACARSPEGPTCATSPRSFSGPAAPRGSRRARAADTHEDLVSGTDATGFIAERDGPDLVAFAKLDPATNTQYLERYIDIHAANRYAYYRNRSLGCCCSRSCSFRIRTGSGGWCSGSRRRRSRWHRGFRGVPAAGRARLAGARRRSRCRGRARKRAPATDADGAALRPEEGRTDSWSHYQRRASALAEVFAVALERRSDAADLLALARELPKGFAGIPRALRADARGEHAHRRVRRRRRSRCGADVGAAASHRIQDYRFCLQMTAMVNAMRSRWSDMTGVDLQATVERFLDKPLAAEFCAIHRVLEQFEYRAEDQQYFQALPIPETVRQARTLGEIAAIFEYEPAGAGCGERLDLGRTPEPS